MSNQHNMSREEMIELLQAIKAGNIKAEDLQAPRFCNLEDHPTKAEWVFDTSTARQCT